MTSEIKEVCRRFEEVTGMRIAVQERAGDFIKQLAKAEPLRRKGCEREECFNCTSSEGGQCDKNGVGYRIECLTCQRTGISTLCEGA